jgi:hypothetical protein
VLVHPHEARMPVTPLGSYAGRGDADRPLRASGDLKILYGM